MKEKSTFSFHDPLKVTIFVSYKINISFTKENYSCKIKL